MPPSTDLVLTHVGAVDLLDWLVGAADLWVHLTTTPDPPDPCDDLTTLVEADWPDYRAQPAKHWTPAIQQDGYALSYADPLLWLRGPGGEGRRVYGYYLTRGESGQIWWAVWGGRPEGFPMEEASQTVTVYPALRVRSEYLPPCVERQAVRVGGEDDPAQ